MRSARCSGEPADPIRRRLVLAAGASLALAACSGGGKEEDVAPPEDLMREHGALNRILLIYEEAIRRLGGAAEAVPFDSLHAAADIVRRFVEEYHEKLEEVFLFPRFEKANKLVDLVATLRKQHAAGRALTASILGLAKVETASQEAGKRELSDKLRLFVRMYRPHEAREDTVLFPALRSVVSHKEFDSLGEQFEDEEHRRFGKAGFEGIVAEIAKLEQAFDVADLGKFTP